MDRNILRFEQAVSSLSPGLQEILCDVAPSAKSSAFEIRLRAGGPLSICCGEQTWFVDNHSKLHNKPGYAFTVTPEEIADCVVSMCSYSVHSHQEEMRNGFISLVGGHRAGICGTAVLSGGRLEAVRDITSVNLRIARDIEGVADSLIHSVFADGLCGLLVVGPPSSGKTTILRDLARQLSGGGALGDFVKVAVVDERYEIGAVYDGVPQNSIGVCCDLLSGYPKAEGIQIALRTMSPQVILCDEIGSAEEAKGMLEGFHCGVKMIASAHAGSLNELLRRRHIRELIQGGAFDKIAMLDSAEHPGEVKLVVEAGDIIDEDSRYRADFTILDDDRQMEGMDIIPPGFFN